MKILFVCGGTAGHINPALSAADTIKRQKPGTKILFAGNPDGMEAVLVPKAGYDFAPIRVQGLQRKLNINNIIRNVKAAYLLLTAGGRAGKIIKDFGPDVVVGTGGYVTYPVLSKAAQLGIKTVTHEQNAFPGITTKLLCKKADKVLVAVPEAKNHLPKGRDYIVTGNPIRQELFFMDRHTAKRELNIKAPFTILSFGGSLGAEKVNSAVLEAIDYFKDNPNIHHIHAAGKYGYKEFLEELENRGINLQSRRNLDIREYIDNMPVCLAAADIVICRAGALSLAELEAVGRASILIPSPNVSENHQYHNAMALADKNAAIVIEEKDLTSEKLNRILEELVNDEKEIRNLERNAAGMAVMDANDKIAREITGGF